MKKTKTTYSLGSDKEMRECFKILGCLLFIPIILLFGCEYFFTGNLK